MAGARSDDNIEDGAREAPKVTTVSRIARGTCNKLPQHAPDGVRPKRRAQKSGDYTVRT